MEFKFLATYENGFCYVSDFFDDIEKSIFVKYDKVFQEASLVNGWLVCEQPRINGVAEIWV